MEEEEELELELLEYPVPRSLGRHLLRLLFGNDRAYSDLVCGLGTDLKKWWK